MHGIAAKYIYSAWPITVDALRAVSASTVYIALMQVVAFASRDHTSAS